MSTQAKTRDRLAHPGKAPNTPLRSAASLASLTVTGQLDAARRVRDAHEGTGVFGETAAMLEDALSHDIADELDRLLFLTLTVAIDYQRDSLALWRHARARYNDAQTRWLFNPREVLRRSPEEVLAALRRGNPQGALRYPLHDAAWWHRNSSTLATEYDGDPRNLFERTGWDVLNIRREVNRGTHFSGLKGAKIFPLWIRILSRVQGYKFECFDELPIPVDVHIARATFTTGLVRGRYRGSFDSNLIEFIRRAWTDSSRNMGEAHMTFTEPLWQLSRLGCTHRNEASSSGCPARTRCPIGRRCPEGTIELSTAGVRIDT